MLLQLTDEWASSAAHLQLGEVRVSFEENNSSRARSNLVLQTTNECFNLSNSSFQCPSFLSLASARHVQHNYESWDDRHRAYRTNTYNLNSYYRWDCPWAGVLTQNTVALLVVSAVLSAETINLNSRHQFCRSLRQTGTKCILIGNHV